MSGSNQQIIIDKIYAIYKSKGFVREEEALDLMSQFDVALTAIDTLTDKLIAMGVVFADNSNEFDGDDGIDKAQIDYEAVYEEALHISPGLSILVEHIRNTRPPQNREWMQLFPQARNGNTYAYERLFSMYLRMVIRIAFKSYKPGELDLDDCIQEGALGLLKAIDSFDINQHGSPASYISFWIMQHISRAIADMGRTIRVPVHMVETINKIEKIESQLAESLGRKPSYRELADSTEISVDDIHTIKKFAQVTESLDLVIKPDDGITLGELIVDEDTPQPFEAISEKILTATIEEVLSTLTQREQEVIRLRFGLVDGEAYTLEEIGKHYNVTRERIRQIEAKAIRKLRHPSRSKRLRDWSYDKGKALKESQKNNLNNAKKK